MSGSRDNKWTNGQADRAYFIGLTFCGSDMLK